MAVRKLPGDARAIAVDNRSAMVATLAVATLAWPFTTLTPGIDSDWSWVAALAIAAKEGRNFGDELVYTYGPLGLLNLVTGAMLYYGGIALATFLYQWLLQLLLAGTVLLAARRSYSAPVALMVAFAVVSLAPDRALVLGFAWCVLALTRADDAPRDLLACAFPPAVGAIAGILVLGKINHGVEIVALCAIALATRPGRRPIDAATFAGALLATAALGWIATGQALGDVWGYLRYGSEIIAGYPAAMGFVGQEGAEWRHWSALLMFAFGSVLVWDVARAAAPRRRWGLVALWLVYAHLGYKAGFVRHAGHIPIFVEGVLVGPAFVGQMLVALAVLPVRPPRRSFALASIATCMVLFTAPVGAFQLDDALDPTKGPRALVDQLRTLSSSDRRGAARAALAAEIRANYDLPPAFVEEIGGREVAFWPYSFGDIPYAYPELEWRPFPTLEPYAAYTPALDRLGAELLASPDAPERIVRSTRAAIDGRLTTFEAPLTTRAILCRYSEIAREHPWQLLARGPDRCGEPKPLATAGAPWGEPVEVPAPRAAGAAVIVRIEDAGPSGFERLRALWLRPDPREVLLDGEAHRLVTATAAEGLLLRVPPDADDPPPFAFAPNPATIAVSRVGGEPGGDVSYSFLELPIDPPAQAKAAG